MDLGLEGIEGSVVGQSVTAAGILSPHSEHPQLKEMLDEKPRCNGFGSSKQKRPDPIEDEGFRASKMPKWVNDLGLRSSDNAQILSFSSSTTPEFSFLTGKDLGLIEGKNAQNVALSYYQQSAHHSCSTGFGSENLNGGMHGCLTGIRGSFTPAQWIELEHQAMIYTYISANVPVPSNLLNPIRKALTSSGFPAYFSVGSYPTQSYGLGPFHLGFGHTDLEPERCRRTDGKKWRCSKDAVPDHKYCEKHIKKGRHRSRKPVEGQTGQAVTGPACSKVVPPISPPPMSSSLVASSGCVSNRVTIAQHQIKGLHPVNRVYDHQGLSMMHPTITRKSKESPFSIPKHQIPMDEPLQPEFGLVSNDSLLNPLEKPFHLISRSYNSFPEYDAQKQAEDHGLSKDDGSPQLGSSSSPTGVLQKASFVSLSNNSSGGSSPRGENKRTTEDASLYDDLLRSAQRLIATTSSIPFG